mmetsp:Transcript_44750/g.51698  ORF Transcript_44750/g.51698 Transcript_44750/m.51698 type:complete len:200 (-) Transcript_44750:318-917(-)
MRIFLWVFTVELVSVFLQLIQELFLDTLMSKAVIRSNTSLSSIQKSSSYDSHRSIVDVSILINDSWALSSEFKNTRDQILSSSLGNKSAFLWTSSKDKHIEFLFGDCNSNLDLTFNDSVAVFIQVLFEQFQHDLGSVRSHFRWLGNDAVTSSDGGGYWRDQGNKWVVPGRKNEADTVRFRNDVRFCRSKRNWSVNTLFL